MRAPGGGPVRRRPEGADKDVVDAKSGKADRRTRGRRGRDDGPVTGGLEDWLSELTDGETSVRRLRKRLEATGDEPGSARWAGCLSAHAVDDEPVVRARVG